MMSSLYRAFLITEPVSFPFEAGFFTLTTSKEVKAAQVELLMDILSIL